MESLCPRLLVRNTKKMISAAELSKQPQLNRRTWDVDVELQTPARLKLYN